MNKATLYYSDKCPETAAFVEKLSELNWDFTEVNITDSMKNLKAFLSLRDNRSEFEIKKTENKVGVPVLLTTDETLLFEIAALEEAHQGNRQG